jgi:L-aminopeptidase/D-esterase-like protein
MTPANNTITAVDGILIGNAQDTHALSGCTVALFERGEATVSLAVKGGWPGSYDTEVIHPSKTFVNKQAILLTGGDVFGFDAVIGIRRYLLERGIASPYVVGKVPNIAGTNIYDIGFSQLEKVNYPGLGYQACLAASADTVRQGNVGAGIGATVGKFGGLKHAMKGGLGSHVTTLPGNVTIGALVVVNAVGNVFDMATGKTIAGMRLPNGNGFMEFSEYSVKQIVWEGKGTTIGIVATNVALSHEELLKVAEMADDGLARSIRPVHMTRDGDMLFAVSTSRIKKREDVSDHDLIDTIGHHGSEVVRLSVLNAVRAAETLRDLPGLASVK